MSVESRDEVAQQPEYDKWHAEKDPEKLWQAIVKTHKVDSACHVTEMMELTARKAYQGIRMGTFETLAMYSERFHETYRVYKATASTSNPVDVKDEIQAMDFFHGLDIQRYGAFKTSMMNGWATKAIKTPKTPNEVYRLAGSWIKQPTRTEGGYAATFVTIEEDARRTNKKRNSGKGKPKPQEGNTEDSSGGNNNGGGNSGEKEPRDLSHIQCFKCKEYGHYSTSKSCPVNKKKQAEENSQDRTTFANATWQAEQEAGMFTTLEVVEEHVVNKATQAQGLLPTEILLDNAANISVMHPMLLKSVRPAGKRIKVKGVGGVQMVVEHVGDLEGFFEVYASEDTKANVLSFAAVEDMYEVTYSRGEGFTVHMPERDILFKRRDNLYVVDWGDVGSVHATVQENESLYSAEQVRRAKLAHEFVRNCGYPSPGEAVHIIRDGNVRGVPLLMQEDIERAYRIYGQHPEYVKGKLVKRTVGRMPIDVTLRSTERKQKLSTDVMEVDGRKFLVTVSDPLNLTLQTAIDNESKQALGMGLQGQLMVLRSRGFEPTVVYVDPHRTFRAMQRDFPGVEIDVGGARDYVPKVDAKIRRLKEVYRAVKSGLPWQLPWSLVKDLVAYAVARINIQRTSALSENTAPRVAFTGMPVQYQKELRFAFGDYVEAHEGTDNTARARSAACIALFPVGNSTGSWELFRIASRTKVRRTNMVKLVTSGLVIDAMNAIAEDEVEAASGGRRTIGADLDQQSAGDETEDGEKPSKDPEEIHLEPQEIPATIPPESLEESPEEHQELAEDQTRDEIGEESIITTRLGREIRRPTRFLAVTKLSKQDWKEVEADKAIKAELITLFQELKALRAVRRASIKAGTKILKSHMFVVTKYLASGEFDKMKARLVADGRDQDPELYPNKSSPTVALQSVFTVLGIVANHKWRVTVKIDIKGAFLQTPMEGEPTYMKLDKRMTTYVIGMLPELKEYVEGDGCLYTLMLKAIYGCVQASALWYALIRRTLEEGGYEVSETDRCVFRKIGRRNRIYLLLLHVDDILANVDREEAMILKRRLENAFGTIQFEEGGKLSYLGMQLELKEEGTVVDMSFYAKQLLDGRDLKEVPSPSTKKTFEVDEDSPLLDEEQKKYFHSTVAKLLFMAKRARPDLLTVVSFLCTRVQGATRQDMGKLERVLGYVKATQNYVMILRAQTTQDIRAYVDAAFALHSDSKSHTGVMVYVGETLVYVSSKKQKCMSKSPTEAELIGLTDNLGFIELFQEFVEFLVGRELKTPIVFQDCSAVVTLVTKGGGVTRTKHLRARMNLGKEMVDQERIQVVYVKAAEMKADGFSKPFDPAEFKKFAKMVQGNF